MQANRGLSLLTHPVVVTCLAIWVVNDHILKERFGNWTTGKLSDAAAMIVFPALVAVAIEPWCRSRRASMPILLAIFGTFLFFASFNLWPRADLATEWVMSLAIDSTLTMDPTDLVVVPLLIIPWRLWHSPLRLRRSWGRLVFAVGVVTTLASGPQGPPAGPSLSGSFVLDDHQTSVTIPFATTIEGEVVSGPSHLQYSMTATYLGVGSASGDALAITAEDDTDTDGTILGSTLRIELTDTSRAPAQIDWTANSLGESDLGSGIFSSEKRASAELTFTAPADATLLEPVGSSELPPSSSEGPVRIIEWQVSTTSNNTKLLLTMPEIETSYGNPGNSRLIRAATDLEAIAVGPGLSSPIPLPPGCPASGCNFSVWVAGESQALTSHIQLFDLEKSGTTARKIEHSAVEVQQTLTGDSFVTSRAGRFGFDIRLALDTPDDAVEAATQFFLIGSVDPDQTTDGPGIRIRSIVSPPAGMKQYFEIQPINECCDPMSGSVLVGEFSDIHVLDEEVTTSPTFTVTTWRLERHDAPSARATIDLS